MATITYAAAASMLGALKTYIDGGSAAIIEFYTAAFATKLATVTFSATAFGAIYDDSPGAAMDSDTITDDTEADDDGTCAVWRMLTESAGTTIMEGTAGTSGADINFNTVAFVAGARVGLLSLKTRMPLGA